jgi:hypothetical protein
MVVNLGGGSGQIGRHHEGAGLNAGAVQGAAEQPAQPVLANPPTNAVGTPNLAAT